MCNAGIVAAAAVGLACFNPGWSMYMTFPCLLAATLEGTLIGALLPAPANRVLHPIIVTCLVINATAAIFGSATGLGYYHTLESYLTKVSTSLLGRATLPWYQVTIMLHDITVVCFETVQVEFCRSLAICCSAVPSMGMVLL